MICDICNQSAGTIIAISPAAAITAIVGQFIVFVLLISGWVSDRKSRVEEIKHLAGLILESERLRETK